MSKSKGTRKTRTRHQKNEVGAKIARMWARAQTSETAAEKFDDAILHRLKNGRLDWNNLNRILPALPSSEISGFMEEVEDLAANLLTSALTNDGDLALVSVKLFTVPVYGSVDAMEAELPTDADAIAPALRASGLSPDQSSVAILPVPLPMASLAAISPQDLFGVTRKAAKLLMANTGDAGIEKLHDGIVTDLAHLTFDEKTSEHQAEITFGIRFLIGFQLTVSLIGEEYEPAPEGFLFQDLSQGDEQCSQDYDIALDAWDTLLNNEAEERDFRVDYPCCWIDHRAYLLRLYVEQNIEVSKALHGPGSMNPEVSVSIDLRDDAEGLHIDAFVGDSKLTSIMIPKELFAYGFKEFLDSLFEKYDVRQVSVDDEPKGILH